MKQNSYFSGQVLSKDLEAAINPGCMFSTNLVHWNITVNQNSSRNRSWIKLMQLHCVIALQCKSEQISVVDSTWQIGSIFAEQVIKTHQWIVKIRIYQWLNLADREHFCGASKSWWRRRWLSHLQKIVDDQIFEYADFSFLLVSKHDYMSKYHPVLLKLPCNNSAALLIIAPEDYFASLMFWTHVFLSGEIYMSNNGLSYIQLADISNNDKSYPAWYKISQISQISQTMIKVIQRETKQFRVSVNLRRAVYNIQSAHTSHQN